VVIEVTAQQFMWNVRYPGADQTFGPTDARLIDPATNPLGLDRRAAASADDVLTINEITVPVNRTVRIRLRSRDVIHSLFLPHFRVKQDAVPGMTPEVIFNPTRAGSFEIACAELCGLAHYRMQGTFNVVSEEEFAAWLQRQGQ
jgi:cytochrome c oxidase subunit 2